MWGDIQAGIPLGILLAFVVGPVFFVVLETAALRGIKPALVLDLGVVTADAFFLTIAYFSSFQLLDNLNNQPGLFVFGGAVLSVYGLVLIFKKEAPHENDQKPSSGDYFTLFAKGFLLNIINIGVLVFWLGVVIVVGPTMDNDPSRLGVFFGTVLTTYLTVDFFKILLAKQLKSKLTPTRVTRIKKGIGLLLVASGVFLMVKGFLPQEALPLTQGIEYLE